MNIKALIASVVIASLTLASAIPITTYQLAVTDKNFNNVYANTYDVLFKEITTVNGVNFKVSNLYGRPFWLNSFNVVGSSGLPSNFYDEKNRVSLYIDSQEIWDQVGKVYGFDMSTDRFKVSDIMRDNSLINVSVRIRLGSYPWPTGDGVWVIESFSASLSKN